MSNLINQYLKKVAKETDDEKFRNSILDRLEDDCDEFMQLIKPKSSFKEANKRMKEIEDKKKNENT